MIQEHLQRKPTSSTPGGARQSLCAQPDAPESVVKRSESAVRNASAVSYDPPLGCRLRMAGGTLSRRVARRSRQRGYPPLEGRAVGRKSTLIVSCLVRARAYASRHCPSSYVAKSGAVANFASNTTITTIKAIDAIDVHRFMNAWRSGQRNGVRLRRTMTMRAAASL